MSWAELRAVVELDYAAGLAIGAASIAYLFLALLRVATYRLPIATVAPVLPPLTVLKPVCGIEPGLYRCLRSFCAQDYPRFQVVFGVRDPDDPAIPIIEGLMTEFPEHDLELVIDGTTHGTNLKVSNLINMYRAAKHDIIIVSDSDTLVPPDCLTAVTAPLTDTAAGAVTCLYKAAPAGGFASMLGALFINDWFLSSAMVDAAMRDVAYCFGPVTALRREAFDAIGGFRPLACRLADDFLLGRLIAAQGYAVRLAPRIVDTVVAESFRSLFQHELRWARTVKTVKPGEHFLSFVTHPLPLLLLALLPDPRLAGMAVLSAVIALRVLLHVLLRRRFLPDDAPRPWLMPLRECLCFAVWAASFWSSNIRWRQRRFAIGHGGTLSPLKQHS